MNYELTKKLKDAGFPQNFKQGESVYMEKSAVCVLPTATEEDIKRTLTSSVFERQDKSWIIKVPTLPELIEACGTISLDNITRDGKWRARQENGIPEFGSTPEEAVASLWLKLNEK